MADPKHGTSPLVIEETPGKKAYCQCGLSAKLPYPDGSHSRDGTGLVPCVVEVDGPGKKAVCQCHRSGNLPWCDGTHARPASRR
ncbi:MAG: CDGSH iron-sulfur domain-containing protein, partial [Planctomycetota bacterium]